MSDFEIQIEAQRLLVTATYLEGALPFKMCVRPVFYFIILFLVDMGTFSFSAVLLVNKFGV